MAIWRRKGARQMPNLMTPATHRILLSMSLRSACNAVHLMLKIVISASFSGRTVFFPRSFRARAAIRS
jgi:hypothetical protein